MHGQLAREFAATALGLRDSPEVKEIFETVVQLAAISMHCGHVGLVLCEDPAHLALVQASDAAVDEADRLQVELRQGPCWSCLHRTLATGTVIVDDAATDNRWPAWEPHLATLGLRSAYSARLDTTETTIGFLTLYDDVPHRFTDETAAIAHTLALDTAAALTTLR
jgi:GAF domain-containing protein